MYEETGRAIETDTCTLCKGPVELIEWAGRLPQYRYEWQHVIWESNGFPRFCPGAPVATPAGGNRGYEGVLLPDC